MLLYLNDEQLQKSHDKESLYVHSKLYLWNTV